MRLVFLTLGFAIAVFSVSAQDLRGKLVGKTYARTFYALIFKHRASYTFYADRVVYVVEGFFVTDKYTIMGKYYADRFVGIDPKTKERYVLHIKIISQDKIKINKQGVDPRYKDILKDKPVEGWHEYRLVK